MATERKFLAEVRIRGAGRATTENVAERLAAALEHSTAAEALATALDADVRLELRRPTEGVERLRELYAEAKELRQTLNIGGAPGKCTWWGMRDLNRVVEVIADGLASARVIEREDGNPLEYISYRTSDLLPEPDADALAAEWCGLEEGE